MPVTLVADRSSLSRPVHLVAKGALEKSDLPAAAIAWAKANAFTGEEGRTLLLADGDGSVSGALFGLGDQRGGHLPLLPGALARTLPEGDWHFATAPADSENAVLGLLLGGYAFTAYGRKPHRDIRFAAPEGVDRACAERLAEGVFLARDLINTPTNDMGPDDVEAAARRLAATHGAEIAVIAGDELLARNFPMIHAVGRASAQAPRLIDIRWGREDAPKVTLVGKGVCFDTGGLDIKPSAGMRLMKKDMGGAAHALALAGVVMAQRLPVRLHLLIPAVENSVAANAFRPGDVLKTRKGLTVENTNTDAEGRLILGDALAKAVEAKPDLILDFATLTGAARVALGPELPALFANTDALANDLLDHGIAQKDPLWRLPLWDGYDEMLKSDIADMVNSADGPFAGPITAALFLRRFVPNDIAWAHFDLFAWRPVPKPGRPKGGDAMSLRAVWSMLKARYNSAG